MNTRFQKSEDGNVTIYVNGITAPDLEAARGELREYVYKYGGERKNSHEEQVANHVEEYVLFEYRNGYYWRQRFTDQYFVRGFFVTVRGETDRLEECYNDPSYTPSGGIRTEIVRANGKRENYHAIRGRYSQLSDPGSLELEIEGYSPSANKNTAISQILQIAAPMPLLPGPKKKRKARS